MGLSLSDAVAGLAVEKMDLRERGAQVGAVAGAQAHAVAGDGTRSCPPVRRIRWVSDPVGSITATSATMPSAASIRCSGRRP